MAITITARPCPDTDLEINGTPEGSFTAGSTIDLQLTDGVNPVTPVSVGRVGDTVTATLPAASTGWVRNPDWLPLPEITAADNRFVGLFLVFEGEYNQLTVNATNNAANIYWGDSTSVTSNGTTQTKVYDYSAISGAVKQYYDGRNYKQVIVDITRLNTLTSLSFSNNSLSALNNFGTINFVDIQASLPETTALVLSASNARQLRICEKIELLTSVDSTYQNAFISLPMLQYLFIPFSHLTTNSLVVAMFQRCGANLKFFNNDNLDIDSPVLTSMFNGSWIRKLGDISSSGGATMTANVFQNSSIEQVGNVTLPNATDMSNFFYQAYNLHTIGVITAPNAVGLASMFTGCNSLKEIVFTDCSNVTTVTTGSQGTFNLCYSLSKLIMPGMRIGFHIAGSNLTAQALNDLFTSLGTASGSQTIIVTGNPGAATCDTTIATAKGYTVTT
jgi:hypothetical protein